MADVGGGREKTTKSPNLWQALRAMRETTVVLYVECRETYLRAMRETTERSRTLASLYIHKPNKEENWKGGFAQRFEPARCDTFAAVGVLAAGRGPSSH